MDELNAEGDAAKVEPKIRPGGTTVDSTTWNERDTKLAQLGTMNVEAYLEEQYLGAVEAWAWDSDKSSEEYLWLQTVPKRHSTWHD
jgi:hypothetical protein